MKSFLLFTGMLIVVGLNGCATRKWVTQQVTPLKERLSSAEGELGRIGGHMSNAERRLEQTDAKAERALDNLAGLQLKRKFVLDLKQGATFAFNSSVLTDEAKREVDGFLSDLEGHPEEGGNRIFLVVGHTDSTGPEDYNYRLGRRRAEVVAAHLITNKKVDPLRVITASYGENAPLVANTGGEGRRRNRRVEILVYREAIGPRRPGEK